MSHSESAKAKRFYLLRSARVRWSLLAVVRRVFGNVLVGGEALEIDGVEHGEHVHGDV